MAAEVTLSAAIRSNLLALSGTERLVSRTQERLASGLRVASPIDDAKLFFEAKALSNRARDFNEKKDGIDQGVSSLSTALEAVEAVDSLVNQLKGLANQAKSATGTELTSIISQYNDLTGQLDNLAGDSSYQGTNLINGTGQSLDISFSTLTASNLSVASVDLTTASTGLDITAAGTTASTAGQIDFGNTSGIDAAIAELDAALSTLPGNSECSRRSEAPPQ